MFESRKKLQQMNKELVKENAKYKEELLQMIDDTSVLLEVCTKLRQEVNMYKEKLDELKNLECPLMTDDFK